MAEAINSLARKVLSPEEGEPVWLRRLGIRFMIGEETQGNFALVEYLIGARALAAPMHTHEREEEYTYVLEGEVGVQIGEEVLVARPGDLVFKPGGVPHAFWNAADEPARALEMISPCGLRALLRGTSSAFPSCQPGSPRRGGGRRVREKVGLEMDMGSIPVLAERTASRSTGPRLPRSSTLGPSHFALIHPSMQQEVATRLALTYGSEQSRR